MDKSDIVACIVGLRPLIDSTVAFASAFGLEALLFSSELWTRLPVAAILLIVMLLISWCVGTTFEAKTDFSALGRVHILKDHLVNLTRSLRGKTMEQGVYEGDTSDDYGQDASGTLKRTETLKEAFSRPWRRRQRASTSSTLVNSPRSNGARGPSGGTGVEMGEMNNKAPVSEV